jgi:hypothetical protein
MAPIKKESTLIEPEFHYTSVMPGLNDSQYYDEPQPIPSPTDFDDDEDKTSSHTERGYNIYDQYFTPEERRMLAEIPENDVTQEINLLHALLLQAFALVPTGPKDKKRSLTPELFYDLHTTVCRTVIILARLVALHVNLNCSRNETADLITETLCEMDPHNLNYVCT